MKILLVLTLVTVFIPKISLSGDVYTDKKIKSRSERGYTNNGRAIYSYKEINSYDDELSSEDLGNIDEGDTRKVRELYNRVIVVDRIESKKDNLEIGDIKVDGRNVKAIDNSVVIDDDININGENVSIGTVRIIDGRADSIRNNLEIKGDLNAK